MLVQLGDPNQVHKLYVSQTRDPQSLVSVEVEENGTYLVSVIPVIERTGIIGSNVEYREEIVLPFISGNAHASLLSTYFVMIYIDTAMTTTDTGFRIVTLLLGNGKYKMDAIFFNYSMLLSGIAIGILLFIIIILCGVILVQCGKNHFKHVKTPRLYNLSLKIDTSYLLDPWRVYRCTL